MYYRQPMNGALTNFFNDTLSTLSKPIQQVIKDSAGKIINANSTAKANALRVQQLEAEKRKQTMMIFGVAAAALVAVVVLKKK